MSEAVGSLEAVMAASSILNVENKVLKYVCTCMYVCRGVVWACKECIGFRVESSENVFYSTRGALTT